MPNEIARQWFIPGEGIDRHVISADIQRYLGNDATVRPGQGTGEQQGIQGYWIRAYRNLTSAMIQDIKADSARWRQEQRATGTREPYEGSATYHTSGAGRAPNNRRDADSPSLEGPYGLPPSSRGDRAPVDRMVIDPPVPQPGRGYAPERGYQQDSRTYVQETRGYPPDPRMAYPADTTMNTSGFASTRPAAVTSPYAQDPRYISAYPQPNDGAPPGYVQQGAYYVQRSQYEQAPPVQRTADAYPSGSFGQPIQGRDPRYQQPEYADPSPYNAMPQGYDQYGGRPVPNLPGQVSTGASNTYGRVSTSTGTTGQERRVRR